MAGDEGYEEGWLEAQTDERLRAEMREQQRMFDQSCDEDDVKGAFGCWARACMVFDVISHRANYPIEG
jgi:hypothetical protein